eukprot:353751-Chlamydomonas_euryale.AAC.15
MDGLLPTAPAGNQPGRDSDGSSSRPPPQLPLPAIGQTADALLDAGHHEALENALTACRLRRLVHGVTPGPAAAA